MSPVGLAVAGLAKHAEVAVGGCAQGVIGHLGRQPDRAGSCLSAGNAAMREDQLADEVDAARHRLANRLARVEPCMQALG